MSHLTGEQEEQLIRFLKELVQTPSISGQEGPIADRLMAEMRAVGFGEVWQDSAGNVIGHIGQGHGPHLVLDAHLDTVDIGDESGWTYPPHGGVVVDGRLYGRGSADMKGGLAAMVYAVHFLARQGFLASLQGDLYLIGVVNEEPYEGEGLRASLADANLQPDMVILGNPTNLQVNRGHRGRLEMLVTTKGRSTHAARPQQGVNALSAAARVIFGVELLAPTLRVDGILGRGSIAVTDLVTETPGRNAIPHRCTLFIDRRLTLGETEARALSEIEGMLLREQVDATVQVNEYTVTTYTGYHARGRVSHPAWLLPKDNALLKQVTRSVERALGYRPGLNTWSFSTDGVFLMGEKGIPTVGFGPGDEKMAHMQDEYVRLSDVIQAVHAYAQMIMDLVG